MIEKLQRPTLVMAPNKTLAAQLANEFRELLPNNAVEYFVSYYDYYQPEAYVPQTDTYIEKDSSINEEVERLRHSATKSLLTRRDVIVVASVSCIYGLGTPQEYVDRMVPLQGRRGDRPRPAAAPPRRHPVHPQRPGVHPRARSGSAATPSRSSRSTRSWPSAIEMFGDEIEALYYLHPLTGEVISEVSELYVFPATHYVAGPERMERAIRGIEAGAGGAARRAGEAGQAAGGAAAADAHHVRHRDDAPGRLLLRHRELLACTSTAGRPAPRRNTLLDYFPEDFLLVIDESHVTVPQIGGMYEGDTSRKRTLVEHGFRLPSAMDNRPLKWEEFLERIGQTVYLSATPGPYELGAGRRRVRGADHPADRAGRPGGRGQADQGPDRRPGARDPQPRPRRTSGCWSPR